MLFSFNITSLLLNVSSALQQQHQLHHPKLLANETEKFPDDFLFGVASSAYQTEGAWNLSGRGLSVWDEFTHEYPERIKDRSNADVGPNSFEYWMDDIEGLRNLKLDFYRFSISWPRVLPTGDITNVNEKGIEYYNKIINKLLENKIEPFVTIFHFDFPQQLQSFGSFTNEVIVDYFTDYVNLLFERFGDRVKYWITFNQPRNLCQFGFGTTLAAPGVGFNGIGEYLCSYNILKSHATAYHLYKEKYYKKQKGIVGISLNTAFYYSDTNDTAVVNRAMQFMFGWFAHPIFSEEGNYPAIMRADIANNSIHEGRPRSRLPTFSQEWIDKIRGSADFLGLNYYTSRVVTMPDQTVKLNPYFRQDKNVRQNTKPHWKKSASRFLYSVPEGFGDVLRWIKKEFNDPVVYVTENGWSDKGELEDNGRIEYYYDHLKQLLDVITNDECNVKAFTAYSLIDLYEWSAGYVPKFGFYKVDMNSTRKERIPRKSVGFMREVATTHLLPSLLKYNITRNSTA